MQELLTQFREIASNPKKQMEGYLAAGRSVILTAPIYTPEEIVHSMGMVPMGVWGGAQQLQEAKRYFPAFIPSMLQSIVEHGIRGTYKGASAIIIPSLSDSLKVLGQNWKYAVPDIPFIPMTYPQNRKPSFGADFTRAGYMRVIGDLEEVTGAAFDENRLAASMDIYTEHNAAMRELSRLLAEHPEISAADRSAIFKSGFFMLKQEHTALVNRLIHAMSARSPGAGKKRVVTSGIICDAPGLLRIFDENGLHIVGDDIAAESRQYAYDAPASGSGLDRLTAQFCSRDNCSLLYDADKKRVTALVELCKERNAAGALIVLTKFCDAEEFDYPLIKKACDIAGLPCILMEIDSQMNDFQQAATLVETFTELLKNP